MKTRIRFRDHRTAPAPRRPVKRKTRITIYLDDEVLKSSVRCPSSAATATRP